MLEKAFYESPDYLTLIEPQNRSKCLVIGRRGTGKSALLNALKQHHGNSPRTIIVTIAPEDIDIIQIRSLSTKIIGTTSKYNLARSAFKILWRYAFSMEVGRELQKHYKFANLTSIDELTQHISKWNRLGKDFFTRFAAITNNSIGISIDENVVGHFARLFPVKDLESSLDSALASLKMDAVILVDKLDEGYEADNPGLAIIAGIAHAASGLAGMMDNLAITIFLRDNIFRSIAKVDNDFSRNLEGQVLRLHWDRYHLLNMICQRLRVAYQYEAESNQKLWDKCTAQNIRGPEGFARCLQLTLYRPRDLLLLLNDAIRRADSRGRSHIDNEDIEETARGISVHRLNDLQKEYESIIAGINYITAIFTGAPPTYTFKEIIILITGLCEHHGTLPEIRQQFMLIGAEGIVLQLYSIGFIGIEDEASGSYVFCHDGKSPDLQVRAERKALVHPCYWIALGITDAALDTRTAESIHDEYDVEVSSETPALRNRRIGQIMAELEKIPTGVDGAALFESWSKQVLEILFAKSLRNLELHPNKADIQRRDVVGSNLGVSPVWQRIIQDYQSRQVVFEIKNVDRELEGSEFRQLLSYLSHDYGRIGFFVTRGKSIDLTRGQELDWVKECYLKHNRLIIKLTGSWLASLLSKIRNPQKHDAPNHQLNVLLDKYSRNYLNIR